MFHLRLGFFVFPLIGYIQIIYASDCNTEFAPKMLFDVRWNLHTIRQNLTEDVMYLDQYLFNEEVSKELQTPAACRIIMMLFKNILKTVIPESEKFLSKESSNHLRRIGDTLTILKANLLNCPRLCKMRVPATLAMLKKQKQMGRAGILKAVNELDIFFEILERFMFK